MTHLEDLLKLSEQLKNLLGQSITSKNREEIIEKANDLIEMRGKHLQQINPPFTENEKIMGEQIIELNVFIQKRMDRLFSDLKSEMKQVKRKKRSNRSYINPYQSVNTIDGMFMDEKK